MSPVEFVCSKGARVCRILAGPFVKKKLARYEKGLRDRNKNTDFTLLTNTCMGGVIYSRLGLQFLSPTVNLWLYLDDFVKLCLDPEHYMSAALEFIPSERKIPVARLDDITVFFEHYRTEAEAAQKWNERKARINYDNLIAVTVLHGEEELETVRPLLECSRFRRVKVLSVVPVPDDRVRYIRPSRLGANRINLLDRDIAGIRKFEKEFDFVGFLNE